MVSFSCSNVGWADGLILWYWWNWLHCSVFHQLATFGMNLSGLNTIDSVLSIRTFMNTSIIRVPTILPSLLSFSLFRTFQSLYILICSLIHLALTRPVGITFTGPIECSVVSIPAALFISITNIFGLCPTFNFIAFESQQLYKIWLSLWAFIICACVNNAV